MIDGPSYPRVLIVGQSFNRTCGGGVTLSNLFEGWPKDRLAAAVFAGQSMDRDICDDYYVLGRDENVWMWPLSLVPRRSTPPSGTGAQPDGPAQTVGSAPSAGRAAVLLHAGLDLLGVGDELRTLSMSAGLRDWIQGFAPDIVYSQLHGLPGMSLIDEITRGLDLPLALHIMDDWPNFLYGRGVLRGVVRGHMERRLRSLMGRASSLMAISGAMADEYAQRYGRTFLAIHNPVDLDRWDALAATFGSRSDGPSDDSLRVVYTGRFGLANEQSISDVAETVSEMSSQGAAVSLQVNTPDHDSPAAVRLAALHGVVVTPAGEYSRVPGLMRAADVLLLPLDFDEEHVQLMRLSMPTKVSEYLATGRPVLTYAPRGSATAEYSRGQGWSLLVDDRDPVAVRQALELLSRDQGLRAEMGSRARRCAEENHDAHCVRERFRAALAAGALGSGGSR